MPELRQQVPIQTIYLRDGARHATHSAEALGVAGSQ
jgi:hypothetical protein